MAFCPNCGAAVEGRFCAKCGTSVAAGSAAGPPLGQPSSPPVYTPAAQTGGLSEGAASALCYVLFAGAIFLAIEPYNRNRNVRFHAFQGLFLFGAAVIIGFVLRVILAALFFTTGMWLMFSLLLSLVNLALFVVWLIALIQASQGKRFKLPIIGDIAERQANK